MTLKSDAKFEKKLSCLLENGTRNLINFDLSTQKSQQLSLYCAPTEQSTYCLN